MKVFDEIKQNACHAITFLPSDNPKEETVIQGLHYKNHGETIKTESTLGDLYDIIIFRKGKDNKFCDFEEFDAILACPYTYSKRMYNDKFYGIVAKKTTTSQDVFNTLSDRVRELVNGKAV